MVNINSTQFENSALSHLGRTISRTPITKTEDAITGRETLTAGTPVNITAIAEIVDKSWTSDETAKLEGYDGFIMVATTTTLNEQDFITLDSLVYEVHQLMTIKHSSTSIFKYGKLLLKS